MDCRVNPWIKSADGNDVGRASAGCDLVETLFDVLVRKEAPGGGSDAGAAQAAVPISP